MTVLLGWLATTLSISLLWPQVWRSCLQRRTSGLSATACWLGVALSACWLLYGVLLSDTAQVATNAAALVASLAILVALLVTQPALRSPRSLLLSGGGAALLLLGAAAVLVAALLPGVDPVAVGLTFGLVISAVNTLACVPQPLALLRDPGQDLSGLSPARWVLSASANTTWLVYGVLTGQPAVWTSATTALVAALVVCGVLLVTARSRRVGAALVVPNAGLTAQDVALTA
ncbi:SemiSWEET transporter [Thalassiella azotivora]